VAAASRERKVATQMGNQGHASPGLRRQVDWLRAGAVGDVHEVHVWTDRPTWPQGADRFERQDQPAPPAGMNWDLWLGPRPARPYAVSTIRDPKTGAEAVAGTYHPGRWRGWLDFGCGALGDMAPHLMDAAVWGLNLTGSCAVEAESEGANDQTFPTSSVVTWHFPARPGMRDGREAELKPVTVRWYEGGRRPAKPADLTDDEWAAAGGDGSAVFVGDRGTMFGPYAGPPRLSARAANGFTPPGPQAWFLPDSPGHQEEFLDAVRGGPAPASNFDYAAVLTETVLLGTVAQRVGRRIEWDAAAMRVTNLPEANQFIRAERRSGWAL
jgi:predicted dehydrogenase